VEVSRRGFPEAVHHDLPGTLPPRSVPVTVRAQEDLMGSSGKSGKSGKGGKFTPGFDWSIKIVPVSPGVAGFQPDVLGAKVGDSLQAQISDIVTWGNTTADIHQPVRADNGESLCDPIAGGALSTPQFVVEGKVGDVIKYKCKFHSQETGSITIVPNFI
jgi:hypothetical protein